MSKPRFLHASPCDATRAARIVDAVLAVVLAVVLAPAAGWADAAIPAHLTDVRGTDLDVSDLATRHTLIFVTLKTAACPVCHEQLRRLRTQLVRLRACGASFIVLAPGPASALRDVATRTGFPYPFVEDVGLELARRLDLAVDAEEIMPALFHVDARRQVAWTQRGRGAGMYGDGELLAYLDCGSPQDDRVAECGLTLARMRTYTSARRREVAGCRGGNG